MLFEQSKFYKNKLFNSLLILLCLILIFIGKLDLIALRNLSTFLTDFFSPISNLVSKPALELENAIKDVQSATFLRDENIKLKSENRRLKIIETKLANTSAHGGRTVYINSAPSNTWKSAGDPPDIYYFRADGQPFNDGTGMVESSYTHPKDYPMQGGWLDARKLKSLSKSHPIRSLRKQPKKKRKTKKNILKKMRKRKEKLEK